MTDPQFSLTHIKIDPRQPPEDGGKPPLLILLHGVGSNERDLAGLASYLDPRLLIVSARAPLTMMEGHYAWYEIQFLPGGDFLLDADQVKWAYTLVAGFVKEVVAAYDADPDHVYLGGFSQGAIMSISLMLTQPDEIAGVVAMSGRLLDEVIPDMVEPDRLEGFPIIWVHGTQDSVIPVRHARVAREFLRGLPLDFTYREYPMAHNVGPHALTDVQEWLQKRLEGADRDL